MLMRRTPEWIRYGAALGLVLVCLAIRLALPLAGLPFLLFIPALLAVSLFLGRGPGLVATGASALAALYFLVEPKGHFELTLNQVFGLSLFVLLGLGIIGVCHTLRTAMVRLIRAEREKSLLFDELTHRTKNNLQMVSSLLHIQSRGIEETAAGQGLREAASRVNVIAKLHERLQPDGRDGVVNMRQFLDELCLELSAAVRSIRPVTIAVEADPVTVGTATAAPIGLIVNELVTNSLKYAFPDGVAGAVQVTFAASGDGYRLTVGDDGIGAAPDAKDGTGSRLTGMLVEQLDGQMTRTSGSPGTITTVVIPRAGHTLERLGTR